MLLSRIYTISIKDSCPESWDKMHPAGNARFCDACSKNVVDFTAMTEKEIAAYFKNRTGNTCGRFMPSQLETTYVQKATLKVPFHRRFVGYLLSFFVSNAVVDKAAAQSDTVPIQQTGILQKLAVNDTLRNDSLAMAQADSLSSLNDSIKITANTDSVWWDSKPITIDTEWVFEIMGMTQIDPVEEHSLIGLCRLKIKDSISKYVKAPVQVTKNDLPVPGKKEPVKDHVPGIAAVLPDDARRGNTTKVQRARRSN